MWIRVLKELRQLGAMGIAAAGLPVLAAVIGVKASWILALLSFALAARLFGAEFDHRTLPRLLAQPMPRGRIWAEKMCAGALALAFALGAMLVTLKLQGEGAATLTGWLLVPAVALATTPTMSLVARDSVRSVWAGFGLYAGLNLAVGAVWSLTGLPLVAVIFTPYCIMIATWLYVLRHSVRSLWADLALCTGLYLATGVVWRLTGLSPDAVIFTPYCIVMATLGYLRFQGLELAADAVRPPYRPLAMTGFPRTLFRSRASGATFRRRASGATGATVELVLKELRVQRSGLAVVPVAVALWLASWLPSLGSEQVRESDLVVLASYVLASVLFVAVPALIGANAVAGERQLGVLAWQLAAPISRRFQWRVKLACCLVLTLLVSGLGVVLTRLFTAGLPIPLGPGATSLLVAVSLVALALGLCGSQLARNPFGAVALALILGVAGAYLWGLLNLTSNFAGMAWPDLLEPLLRLSSPFGNRLVDGLCGLTLLVLIFATPSQERWLAGGRLARSPVLRVIVALALSALAAQIYILTRASEDLDRELAAKGAELTRVAGGEGAAEALTRDAAGLVPLLDYGNLVSFDDPALHRDRYRQPVSAAMSLVAGVDGIDYSKYAIDRWFWLREARGVIYSGAATRHQVDGYFTLRGRSRWWHSFSLVQLWFQDHRSRQLDRRMRQNVALETVRLMPYLERSPAVDRDRLRQLVERSPLASPDEANRPPKGATGCE